MHRGRTTEAGYDAMVATAVREFGRVDALYCNPGDSAHRGLELHETPPDAWDYLLDVNLRGHFLCARATIGQMLRQDPAGGVLVHAAASAGVVRSAHQGYAAAKAGLLELVRRTAGQYRDRNIRINTVGRAPLAARRRRPRRSGCHQASSCARRRAWMSPTLPCICCPTKADGLPARRLTWTAVKGSASAR